MYPHALKRSISLRQPELPKQPVYPIESNTLKYLF